MATIKFTSLMNFRATSLGSHQDVVCLTYLWHTDREPWWPSLHFKIQDDSDDASSHAHAPSKKKSSLHERALVCFILDSEANDFVSWVVRTKPNSMLNSLIAQLRQCKVLLDEAVRLVLSTSNLSNKVLPFFCYFYLCF